MVIDSEVVECVYLDAGLVLEMQTPVTLDGDKYDAPNGSQRKTKWMLYAMSGEIDVGRVNKKGPPCAQTPYT